MNHEQATDYLADHEADMRMIRECRDLVASEGDEEGVAFLDAAIDFFNGAALAASLILMERDEPCLDPERN